MAIAMPAFNGQLNSNEIYGALFNVHILFIDMVEQDVGLDPIVSELKTNTGMYGDTGLMQGMDIQGTYNFGMDAEAANLLAINRNKTQVIEKVEINQWRQTDITNDTYISKRAFMDEGAFSIFNNYLVGTLSKAFSAFENGYVKTRLGTYGTPTITYEIKLPTKDNTLETSIKRASALKGAMLQLGADIKDNQRKYNKYKFYSKYDLADMKKVWNVNYEIEVKSLVLPTIYNKEELDGQFSETKWTPKWFGNVLKADGTSTGKEITMVEMNSDGTTVFPIPQTELAKGTVRLFPGDVIPTGIAYKKEEAYLPDEKIIGILFYSRGVKYMGGYEEGESFRNPRSSTTNHYLRKGFSDVYVSGLRPFIIVKEIN